MNLSNLELEKLEVAAEIFKGFGNPIRLRIIDALQENSMRVMELSEMLGYPQPIISQQLKILKSVGIVQKIREGSSFCYKLTNQSYSDIIKCIRGSLGF
jgi:ArsR family transcriptional regulator